MQHRPNPYAKPDPRTAVTERLPIAIISPEESIVARVVFRAGSLLVDQIRRRRAR